MLIRYDDAPIFIQGGTTARGYAAPSRGAAELSLWRVALAAGERSPVHVLDAEEVFLALGGSAQAELDGELHEVAAGDCLLVAPGRRFALAAGPAGFDAVCAMRAGGQATILPSGTVLTPPWAA